MDRKLKIAMIVIWSVIGIALINLLVFCIINNRGLGYYFSLNGGNSLISKVQKQEVVPLSDCSRIILDCSSDDVIISSSDDDKLKVIQSANRNLNENEKFTIDKRNGAVSISDRYSNFTFNLFGGLNKKIELFIPKNYAKDLEVKSTSGDINIDDDLNLNNTKFTQSSGDFTSTGKITADQIDIKASSGDIKSKNLKAKSYGINSSSGDITIDSIIGSGEISASSGDIKVTYGDIYEYADVSAHSGDINLRVPQGLSFEFDGDCSSGDIDSNLDLNYKNKDGNKATAKVGDGPYKKINVQTTSGDIDINQQ